MVINYNPDMWQEIITELNELGMKDVDIARELLLDKSTISRLGSGETFDPKYSVGISLVDLVKRKRKGRRK